MIAKTYTYTDYNGVEKTETVRFNLSRAELTKMELSEEGGFTNLMKKIVDTKSTPELVKFFDQFLKKSYGEISPDGRRFIKSDELSEEFAQTEIYSMLFMDLLSDDRIASEFVLGVVPADLAEKAKAEGALPERTDNAGN